MLPEKLSTNLTSLNPDEDRLAVVVEMTVAADGSLTKSAIYRATVRNHAKLAYNSVAAWLEGNAAAPAAVAAVPGLEEQLRRQRPRRAVVEAHARSSRRAAARHARNASDLLRRNARRPGTRRIEPREGVDRGFHGRRQRRRRSLSRGQGDTVAAPRAAHAPALGPHRRAGRAESASSCRRCPMPSRSTRFCTSDARQTPIALPIFRCRSSSCWARANTRSKSRACPRRGTLRSR